MIGRDFIISMLILCTIKIISSQSDQLKIQAREEAKEIVTHTISELFTMFMDCVMEHSMPNQRFIIDDLKSYVIYPSKTTVGFAPKFTSNRKFFANLINTKAFKDIMAKDGAVLRQHLIKKIRYCDEIVIDQEILNNFYDREVDQNRM